MFDTVLKNPWVRALGALGALAVVVLLAFFLRPVLVPLFLAFLIAYALNPVVDIFEKRGIPRVVTIVGTAVVALLVLASIPLFLMPRVIDQAEALTEAAKAEVETDSGLRQRLDAIVDSLPLEDIVRRMGWVEEDATDVNPRAVIAGRIGSFAQEHASRLMKAFLGAGQSAGSTVAGVFTSIGRGALGLVVFLGNLVLFSFVAAYLLKDFHSVVAGAKELVPPRYRDKVFDIMRRIDEQIRSFVRGQALVCLCLGIMYGIGLVICGVPFGIIIAIFGGVASFVPYLGAILTIGPAVILTLLQHGIDWHIIGVVATFAIAQAVEGNFLTPKIVGGQVGLNPVWVILAIMVFSSTFGFLGLLLAVPIAASLKVLVLEGVAYYRASPLFETEGASEGGAEDDTS